MKSFEEFLQTRDVRRVSRDFALGRSLLEFSERRIENAKKMSVDENSAFLVYEAVYEALREIIDALLALEGYKSYSHVASISFLRKYPEITPTEIAKLDNAREKRNLAKYYAKPITLSETKELFAFFNALKPRLVGIFNKILEKHS